MIAGAIATLITLLVWFFYNEENKSDLDSLFAGLAFAGLISTIFLQQREMQDTREEMKKQTRNFDRQIEIAEIQNLYSCIPSHIERMEKLYIRAESGIKKRSNIGYKDENTLGCNFVHHLRALFIALYDVTYYPRQIKPNAFSDLKLHLQSVLLFMNFCGAWAVYIRCWEHQIENSHIESEKKEEIYPNIWNSLFYDDLTLLSACYIERRYISWSKEEVDYVYSEEETKRPSLHHILIAIPKEIPAKHTGGLVYILLRLLQKNINLDKTNINQQIIEILQPITRAQEEYQNFSDELKLRA